MLGTAVNSVAIIICGLLGTLIGSRLTEKYRVGIMHGVGISVIFVGVSTAIPKMTLPESNPVLFIVSLVIGGAIGEWLNIDKHLNKLGGWLQNTFAKGDNTFSNAFVSTSVIFCVGTMAILGAIQSGTSNDHSILFAKSALDGVTSIIVSATYGIGVVFSAISVFIYQGVLTLLSGVFARWLTDDMLREISVVGGILITCIGLDMLEIKKIKVVNFLPSVLVPVVYYLIILHI